MVKKLRFVFVLAAFLLGFPIVFQSDLKAQYYLEIGGFAGGAYYIGDINPQKQFNQLQPAFGFIGKYDYGTRWAFRFSYTNCDVTASDEIVKYREERMLSLKTKINDFSFLAEFNFLEYFIGTQRDNISPYIFGGFSIFHFQPYTLDGVQLHSIQTENVEYSTIGFSIPFGVGVKYSLGKRVGLALEWRMHKAFTDYIDDIGNVYPGIEGNAIESSRPDLSDPSGFYRAGMQRGDENTKDWYSCATLIITYKFRIPVRTKCINVDRVNY